MVGERLYYNDSHLRSFDATVVGISTLADGRSAVLLNRTAFYPTGGGQPSDTGYLSRAKVVECISDENDDVLHVIEGTAPAIGESVSGEINWAVRLDHLQQHTGQHILSQAFVSLLGAETKGFRMMDRLSEIDVALTEPTDEKIERAVSLANQVIWSDAEIVIHNVDKEEAEKMNLRKESAREGTLRVIEIRGFDLSPCGGTHASRTGEVGALAVKSWERAKGMARITFVAGNRLVDDYVRANSTARSVAAIFSAARDDTPELVGKLLAENRSLSKQVDALEILTVESEAQDLNAEAQNESGNALVRKSFEERSAVSLKRLANAIARRERTVALLASSDDENIRVVFARSKDAPGDMNLLVKEACRLLNGRGGGTAEMAQGGGKNTKSTEEILDQCVQMWRGQATSNT